MGGHKPAFKGEARWGHPHSSYAGFLVQCPVPPRATVTFCIKLWHKLPDLPRAHRAHEPWREPAGFPVEGWPFARAACPCRWPWGSRPSQHGCRRGRGELWALPLKDKMGRVQGCSEAAQGVRTRSVPRPRQEQPGCRNIPGTARRSCSSSRTENKSASCSCPVFKARKVGAARALPGWAALPAPAARPDLGTCGDRRATAPSRLHGSFPAALGW